jgi:hypothetical protein
VVMHEFFRVVGFLLSIPPICVPSPRIHMMQCRNNIYVMCDMENIKRQMQ